MTFLELCWIQLPGVCQRFVTLGVIPGIGKQNAADIPKNGFDCRQVKPPIGSPEMNRCCPGQALRVPESLYNWSIALR